MTNLIKYADLKKATSRYADEIQDAVTEVLRSGWFLKGEKTANFEQHFAEYIGTHHCIGCGNGLDSLTLILKAYIELGVMNPGDEVIVPANTYIASILAITENQLRPVLVEPDISTFQIDERKIIEAITPRTKAIMIVHLYGKCAYTAQIGNICKQYGLKLIEDNAQAHGCRWNNRRTGSLGDAAGHSFYPTKNIGALGDAGAVTTNDTQLAEVVRALGNYGSQKHYVFDYIGMNSRMDEMQAAVLDVKLRHLDEDNALRRSNALRYIQSVHCPDVALPSMDYWEQSVFHIFPVLTPRRDELQSYLNKHGVQTEIHYPIPPHKQKCYKEWNEISLPVTERIHREELSLPVSPALDAEEQKEIIDIINSFA